MAESQFMIVWRWKYKNILIYNISKKAESQFMIVVDVFAHTNAN